MSEKLFPARERCKKCRCALGATATTPVYQGLFCSPKCAQMAEPAQRAADAPRECKTMRDGQWVFKRRYRSEGEIPDKLREDASTSWYTCSACGHLHVGHSRMGEAESFRKLKAREDLADFLVKRRGKASHTTVAKAEGVRPIRLKELETGVKHEDGLDTLLKVSKVLRFDLGVALQKMN